MCSFEVDSIFFLQKVLILAICLTVLFVLFVFSKMSDNKKKKVNTLDSFFSRKQKTDSSPSTSSTILVDIEAPPTFDHCVKDNPVENLSTFEISRYVKKKVPAIEIPKSIENLWMPLPNHKFPVSGKRNLKFQYNWFNRWKWLAYSKAENGAYCKFCVFFAETGGVGSQTPEKFVKQPFNNWKDAKEVFDKHQTTQYHKFSVLKATNQILIKDEKQESVNLQLDTASKNKII